MTSKQFRPVLFALLGVSVLASCGGGGSTGSTSVTFSDSPERFVRDTIAPDGSLITGASCVSTGTVEVNKTIVVKKGETYDGDCRTFQVRFGNGSQDEGQPPVFRLEDNATLKNVIIGDNGADGVHTYGDVTIDNLTWMDVGEDALTIKKTGTVIVRNIDGYDASDKFFQINAPSTLRVDNCVIKNAEKGLQQNGGTTFKIDVSFNRCHLIDINRSVFHTIEGTKSVAKLSNSITDNVKRVCEGVWDKCTVTDSSEPPGDDSGGSGGTSGGTGGSGGSIGPGSEDSIQEGESGYCSADSLIESDHSGYEGIGFVNTENSRGVTVEWQVKVDALAQYNVSVRYANGSNANRGGTLIANGDSRNTAVYDLGRTGAWTNWTSESQLITLQKGSNRLVLRADTSSGLANIDSIRIAGGKGANCSDGDASTGGSTGGDSGGGGSSGGDSGGGGSSGGDTGGDTGGGGSSGGDTGGGSSDNRTLTIEDDETGFCRMDGAIDSEHNGYKGDGFLNTDNENGAAIEWQVNSDAANNYDIRIRFANGGNSKRDGTLTVNNNSGSAVVYDFGGTGGWDRWSDESHSIVLQAGSNRIVLKARTSAGLPNIDSIRISGESPYAGDCSDSGGSGGGSGGSGGGSDNSGAEVKLNNGRWVATAAGSTVYNGNRFFDAVNAAIDNQNGGTINIRDSGKSGSDGGEVYAIRPGPGQTLNFNNNTVTANGGELVIPVYCDRRDDITIRNLRVKGNPRYGVWFKGCSDITLENISMDLDRDNPVGLGIRVDASSGPASNLTIKGNIDINGSKTHAIETYGIDGFDIGDVTVTNSGGSGLLLNDSRNGRVGKVVGRNNDPDGGYATFRVANDNGPNVEVESIYSRNSGRGFFSVSNSRGTTVRFVDIADTNKQGILLQNARDTRVLDGVVSNGNPNCQLVESDSSRLDVDGC